MSVDHVSEESELTAILREKKYVVVDFFASWCGPCKQVAPFVTQLAGNYPSIYFCKVDVDESEELAALYSVTGMPTFKFFRNGKLLSTLTSGDKTKLKAAVEQLLMK